MSESEKAKPAEVVIVDIRMPFGSMVVFMIKWAFAAIPAVIAILFGYLFVASVIGSVLRSK